MTQQAGTSEKHSLMLRRACAPSEFPCGSSSGQTLEASQNMLARLGAKALPRMSSATALETRMSSQTALQMQMSRATVPATLVSLAAALGTRMSLAAVLEMRMSSPATLEARMLLPAALEMRMLLPATLEAPMMLPATLEAQMLLPGTLEAPLWLRVKLQVLGRLAAPIQTRDANPRLLMRLDNAKFSNLNPILIDATALVPLAVKETTVLVPIQLKD